MLKIGTHNSATGEKGVWWCKLFTPFARTQSKRICEQWLYGCTMFDIRVKKLNGVWHCAHGLWYSRRLANDILYELNTIAKTSIKPIYVSVTYEGGLSGNEDFAEFCKYIERAFTDVKFTYFAVKYGKDSNGVKVKYDIVKKINPVGGTQGFLALDGHSWHTYLPIPWLWNKLYGVHVFDNERYNIVDFL